ncbi:hypothetical protein B0H10DRAFT_2026444 [Mycena sp. CBHHK59/15]|nr:hypothetical protein B0H10DRAFT_2026444 [Mycena sp. CBHHK59/15]
MVSTDMTSSPAKAVPDRQIRAWRWGCSIPISRPRCVNSTTLCCTPTPSAVPSTLAT